MGMRHVQPMPLDVTVVAVALGGLERIAVLTLTSALSPVKHHVTTVARVLILKGHSTVCVPLDTQVIAAYYLPNFLH